MSIATEILSLRRDKISSVAALLAAMDWRDSAQHGEVFLTRDYAVLSAADVVLLNVAVHALDSQWERSEVTRTSPAPSQLENEATQTPPVPSREQASKRRWRWPRFFGTHVARIHATS
jgi:hypothetical protein